MFRGSLSEESFKEIEKLRSEIAQDTQGTAEDSLLTFTSPFKIPPGGVQLDQHQKGASSEFLQVPLIYCDQTASNRTLTSIENYMEETCRPLYGNTHTDTSITGAQTTAFVAEARQIVAEETNAKITGKASSDVVLFAGSGTTAAVELLIDCLGIKHASMGEEDKRPVVFVGPYEHHSNILPWRETGCEIVMVPECMEKKTVDYEALEKLLKEPIYNNRLKMGTFSAASNVTGKVSDVDRIADTLHRHGALAFFDYATGAPYMTMDMNPPSSSTEYPENSKDAIFFSPHKMIGGVGTPGVLVIKKHLVDQTNAPGRSGGGTVFYVTNSHHRFLSNRVERYEGGTPNVAGILRIGLAFLFKRQVEKKFLEIVEQQQNGKDEEETGTSSNNIPRSLQSYEFSAGSSIANYLKQHAPNLLLLDANMDDDTTSAPHLPIFSFLIKCGNRFLHYNYVCAILNDLFGIQSRGGCQCAGPYSQRLLGLSKMTNNIEVPNTQNEAIEHALLHFKESAESLRPGYTRLSLPFKGLRSGEVKYVLDALVWVAKNGWMLMCNYRCNHRTGEWRHASRQGKPLGKSERKWLSHFDRSSNFTSRSWPSSGVASTEKALKDALANADYTLAAAMIDQQTIAQALKMNDGGGDTMQNSDGALEQLRWYITPKECATYLSQGIVEVPGTFLPDLVGGLKPVAAESYLSNEGKENSQDVDMVSRKHDAKDGIDHPGQIQPDVEEVPQPKSNGKSCRRQQPSPRPTKKAKTLATQSADNTGENGLKGLMQEGFHDAKNETKKPARGKASWGHGQFVEPILGQTVTTDLGGSVEKKGVESGGPAKKKRDSGGSNKKKSDNQTKSKARHVKPPAKLMRQITQAVIQWSMLEEGDKLLLGLSGGKDSLSLLHCLMECQRKLPIKFEIEVCTIDPQTPSFDPSPLIPYVESLGLKYHYIRDDIVARASAAGKDGKTVSSLCAYCARMKRGNLYTCARNNGCNKLVLAQHLDDCAESFLMSTMHNGFLRTMKAHYKIDAGDLAVIRPMVYCRESLMTAFAKSAELPVINENCPACFEEPKERARMKKLLSREESLYPHIYDNVRRSLIPLMHNDMATILRSYTEEAVSRSRKGPSNGKKDHQKKEQVNGQVSHATEAVKSSEMQQPISMGATSMASDTKSLSNASEEELLIELAKRKAAAFSAK